MVLNESMKKFTIDNVGFVRKMPIKKKANTSPKAKTSHADP
jgi:hypothetical protein